MVNWLLFFFLIPSSLFLVNLMLIWVTQCYIIYNSMHQIPAYVKRHVKTLLTPWYIYCCTNYLLNASYTQERVSECYSVCGCAMILNSLYKMCIRDRRKSLNFVFIVKTGPKLLLLSFTRIPSFCCVCSFGSLWELHISWQDFVFMHQNPRLTTIHCKWYCCNTVKFLVILFYERVFPSERSPAWTDTAQ